MKVSVLVVVVPADCGTLLLTGENDVTAMLCLLSAVDARSGCGPCGVGVGVGVGAADDSDTTGDLLSCVPAG